MTTKQKPLTKKDMQVLADRFGGCGCKDACQMEQYGEQGAEMKPRGRFSVCETEAEKRGLKMKKDEANDE